MSDFPASKYARYKRATAFFLDWLLNAQGLGRYAGQHLKLSGLGDVVHDIAAEPSTLTPKLLNALPKALAACQCSITLREHVARFFPEDDKAQKGHRHFLQLLRNWHSTLKKVPVEQDNVPISSAVERGSEKLENYYEVLELDEDYFPDEEVGVAAGSSSKSSKADRERLFNEAFAEDLRLEVIYFFLELEELVEGVFTIYDQVKKGTRSMVEATVAVKLAMDTATALTAKLQLRYPALKTAEDVGVVLMDNLPENFWGRAAEAVMEFWRSFAADGTFTFVPGMLVVEFRSVLSTLCSFTTGIPTTPRHGMVLREGYFGETYGEERTPAYVFPDASNMVILLLQQLPHLYNAILDLKMANGGKLDTTGVTGPFMGLLNEYFTSRKVTVPLVFACICWVRSVAALQGNAGLSRNVGVTIKHSTDLTDRIKATAVKRAVQTGDLLARAMVKQCDEQNKQASKSHHLARANPLLAGFLMLTFDLQYLQMASDVLTTTTRLRAFCHLYNALVEQGFLQKIPFFEQVLEVYEGWVFTPSRAAAVRGIYNRTYLLSSNYTTASVNEMYRSGALPVKNERGQAQVQLSNFSKIYRLMTQNDKSFLGGTSSKAMLIKAADTCAKELFESRVLSRDLLTLNDDLTDVFHKMADDLSQPRTEPVENAAMMFVMPFLDGLQPDGSMNMGALPGSNGRRHVGAAAVGIIRSMCAKAAAVIQDKFATPPTACDQKYFTFPSNPDFATQEYGSVPVKTATLDGDNDSDGYNNDEDYEDYEDYDDEEEGDSYDVLSELMDLMGLSDGPLRGSDLKYFKAKIKRNPGLLSMLSMECLMHTMFGGSNTPPGETRDDLCTLLHHAAAGSAHDAKLVEWMIHQGALANQPTQFCRMENGHWQRSLPVPKKVMPNTMAVHSAAIAGHEDIVRILLEADNMIDLNTPTFHSKETLAHLAVKYGHRSLFNMLRSFGADICIKDGNGKRVCDVTSDRTWSREIAGVISEIEQDRARTDRAKNRDVLLRHQSMLRAERVRKSVAAQRDEERQRELANENVGNASGSKKKKSKKKGKKGKKDKPKGNDAVSTPTAMPTEDTESAEVSSMLKDLLLSGTEVPDKSERTASIKNSLDDTVVSFARLRDPNIPADDKTDDVERVCNAVRKLQTLINACAHPNRMNTTDRRIRTSVASEAAQITHLMQKFHRVDHAAVTVPALSPVRELCDTTLDFAHFVLRTAQLFVSVDRKPQAREVLDVLEKRLLKTPFAKREPPQFRDLVETYASARNTMGLGRTSSADSFSELEWYLSSAVESYRLQATLDKMVGQPFYFEYSTADAYRAYEFENAIDAASELSGVVCCGKRALHVVYGGRSEEDVARVRELVLQAAERTGVKFTARNSQPCTATLRFGGFVFSAAGVVRAA